MKLAWALQIATPQVKIAQDSNMMEVSRHMADCNLVLTEEERKYLEELLDNTLKEVRVEEHRTRSPSYREYVLKNEHLIEQIQQKVRSK